MAADPNNSSPKVAGSGTIRPISAVAKPMPGVPPVLSKSAAKLPLNPPNSSMIPAGAFP